MAGSLHKYTVQESGNAGLGQAGAYLEISTTDITSTVLGDKIVTAISMIEDVTFTTLTPQESIYIGTANGTGDALTTSETFPAGMTIFGRWSAFRLNSGKVIAYFG